MSGPSRSRFPALAAVFCVALAVLGYNLNSPGLAETYVDPVAKIPAQDEAVYSSTALHMAESGGWLTPMFLGRYALYKPPVLYWTAGVSAKILGPSPWALRLPSLLAGAFTAALLFAWIWGVSGLPAALAVCALLLFDRVFFELSRLVLTDMPLTLWIVVALAAVHWKAPWWITGIAAGLAILTKGVGGFVPLLVVLAAGGGFRRFAQICGVAALVAAPWHLYQLAVHTRWFWAEYILTEHFAWAFAAPSQSTQENPVWYYARRLWLLDPALCLTAMCGAPFAFRERDRLAAAWAGVAVLALLAFGYRNTSYLMLLVPALCLIAAKACRHWGVAAVVVVAAVAKAGSLPYGPEHPIASAPALGQYASLHRVNDLVIVAPDDEFLSATLPLRHVRYVFWEPSPTAPLPLDFKYLGITVTVQEFNDLAAWRPVFERRLAEFGLPSAAPIATVITARSPAEIQPMIDAHPSTDFYLAATHSFVWGRRVY